MSGGWGVLKMQGTGRLELRVKDLGLAVGLVGAESGVGLHEVEEGEPVVPAATDMQWLQPARALQRVGPSAWSTCSRRLRNQITPRGLPSTVPRKSREH